MAGRGGALSDDPRKCLIDAGQWPGQLDHGPLTLSCMTTNRVSTATLAAHGAVGLAGAIALHAACKPETPAERLLVWFLGAAAIIWLHSKFDLPVARFIATALAALG